MSRGDWRVGWEEGSKDRKNGIRDEPARSNFEVKEASVVRGETKIRDKRSVTVRFSCAESMLDSKGIDSSTMYIFCLGKVGQDRSVGSLVEYVREL